jgi:hypothetical protein
MIPRPLLQMCAVVAKDKHWGSTSRWANGPGRLGQTTCTGKSDPAPSRRPSSFAISKFWHGDVNRVLLYLLTELDVSSIPSREKSTHTWIRSLALSSLSGNILPSSPLQSVRWKSPPESEASGYKFLAKMVSLKFNSFFCPFWKPFKRN